MNTHNSVPCGQRRLDTRSRGILLIVLLSAYSTGALASIPLALAGGMDVVNGERLTVNGVTHVLYGIKAPEIGEQCRLRGKSRDCGILARAGLKDLTAGATVICKPSTLAPAQSKCLSDGYDLSEGMIYTGWAVTLPTAPQRLHRLMRRAKAKRHGLWHK